MKWQFAIKRSLEMAVWAFVPVAALSVHHVVQLKSAFLQQHQFIIANVNDRTLRAEHIWQQLDQHFYGMLCVAAILMPVIGCFVQHLGLRWWWRVLIVIAASFPVLWYARVSLHIFGKLITSAT